jgi:uncharacterized membrane protein
MSLTHLHLLVTHLSIYGSIFGGLVLLHGIWTRSIQTKIAAYNIFIISAIAASIAYFSGEEAEETVENIQGIAESTVEQHEDFAVFALVSLIILGASSIFGIIMHLRKPALSRGIATVILIISIISFFLIARTGYLGGQIRHTETNSAIPVTIQTQEHENDD